MAEVGTAVNNVTIRILNIDEDCTDNGAGLRTAVYVAGCTHACFGCHNAESWDVDNGTEMRIEDVIEIIEANPLSDVTLTGGDPLTTQYSENLALLKAIKGRTRKNVWLYTGYRYEQVKRNMPEVLEYIDVMVDGRYVETLKDLSLSFRGSSNQRIIDVKESLRRGVVVVVDD